MVIGLTLLIEMVINLPLRLSLQQESQLMKRNEALERRTGKNDRVYWWKVPMSEFEKVIVLDVSSVDVPSDPEVLNFIHSSYDLKPKGLVMKELKWKYLVRSCSW